ncbi:amino acid permease [Kitasatospora gansuensis]
MLGLQLFALLGFGVAAFARPGAEAPSLAWLDPLGFADFGSFAEAVLLCLFIYWGWDALITANEETRDGSRVSGKAAVLSTLILLGTYLFTAFAAIGYAGTGDTGTGLGNPDSAGDVLATLAPPVLGTALAKVMQLAVCVSAVSALLTSLVGSSRGALSMSAHGALPRRSPGSTRADAPPASGRSSSAPPPPSCWCCSPCCRALSSARRSSASAC